MINSSLKEKYWDSATDKQMVISVVGTNQKIDNSMLEIGTFSLEESLCSESEIKFGACEANCVKFTARNTAGSIIGKTISIEEMLDGDTENPMPYGIFKVASDVPTADRTKRQITAYDAMYDIINADVKSWYAGLSFPMSLKQFRDSFFAYLGIEQEDISLVNDSVTVNKTLVASQTYDSSAVTEESSISGKTVITAICEINGCFGNINRNGKFQYVILPTIVSAVYPSDTLYPSDDLFPADANTESMSGHYITFDYEDFQSQAITQLEIRADDNTAGAIVGKPGNNYVISGNFLVSDKTGAELEQIANNVLPVMAQAAYTPIKSCTTVGNPCLELGDPIRFNTSREVVETYLLQRTLTGVQSKRDSIVAQGTETHTAKTNSIRETLESVQRRTGKLERNADHLLSTYEDLEEQTSSKFEQTADAITAEVKRAQGTEVDLAASISVVAGEVSSKVSSGDVVSEINQSAEEISLKSNRLVVSSDNFELTKDGKVTMIDAVLVNSLIYKAGEGVNNFPIIERDGRGIVIMNIPGVVYGRTTTDNVHFEKTPIVDNPGDGIQTYLAREKWVKDNFAKASDIPNTSDFVTSVSASPPSGGYTGTIKKAIRFLHTTKSNSSYTVVGDVYTIETGSDRRIKDHITDLPEELEAAYLNLHPVKFRYKPGLKSSDSNQYHYGFISQELEKALQDVGIGEHDTSLYEYLPVDTDEHVDLYVDDKLHHVNYRELHALHVQMIQKQQHEIEDLKQENENLRKQMQDFERRLSALEGK